MADAREWLATWHEALPTRRRYDADLMYDALLAVLNECEPTAEQYRRTGNPYDEGAMDLAGAIEAIIDEALGVSETREIGTSGHAEPDAAWYARHDVLPPQLDYYEKPGDR